MLANSSHSASLVIEENPIDYKIDGVIKFGLKKLIFVFKFAVKKKKGCARDGENRYGIDRGREETHLGRNTSRRMGLINSSAGPQTLIDGGSGTCLC